MKKKILAVLLATLLGATALAACGEKGGAPENSSNPSSEAPGSSESIGSSESDGGSESDREYIEGGNFADDHEHYVDDELVLHDRTITPSDRVFIKDGVTDYIIIAGTDDSRALEGISLLRAQLASATGANVPVFYDVDQDLMIDEQTMANREIVFTPESKYIVLSHEALEQEASVQWRADVNLEYSGFMIQTMGDSVFMKVNSIYGYQKVVQAFLKQVIGYEWYAADTIVYTKDGSTMPDMNIVEKPDFDLVWQSGYMGSSQSLASPMTHVQNFAFSRPGEFCHNSLTYIPVSNFEAHRDWFAYEASAMPLQLCYTAHGNKAEYDAMLQLAYEGVMKTLNEDQTAVSITFTRQDVYGNCVCDTCKAIQNSFNDSLAATYMFFVNDLDTLIQAELQRQADEAGTEKRDVTVLFFAYREVQNAPVFGADGDYTVPSLQYVENDDGSKTNILEYNGEIIELPFNRTYENGLECNENVGCFYAPIDAIYEESFYHSVNKDVKETFEKWGLLTDRLYCWIYDTNFVEYVMPYNSYDSIPDTLRFLKSAGGTFLFNQGARENEMYTGFGSLRTYLTYTLSNEVNLDAGVLTDKWFKNYFREAEPYMRKFHNQLVAHMEWLQVEYPAIFYGDRRANTENPEYWPYQMLQGWLKLCDQAFQAIKKYETSDPELYQALWRHITAETITPRYLICEYYAAGYYTPAKAYEFRTKFMEDCNTIGFKQHHEGEGTAMQNWFTKWGI